MAVIADELRRIPMSQGLIGTLARAAEFAQAQYHGEVSLEHLLLSITDDADAYQVLAASHVDLTLLKADVAQYLGGLPSSPAQTSVEKLQIALDLRRILEAAAAAASQGRRRDINGAIVLAAIVGDGKSSAAHMLRSQGLTFDAAIKALQRAMTTPGGGAGAAPGRPSADAEDFLATARERVQKRAMPGLPPVQMRPAAEPEPEPEPISPPEYAVAARAPSTAPASEPETIAASIAAPGSAQAAEAPAAPRQRSSVAPDELRSAITAELGHVRETAPPRFEETATHGLDWNEPGWGQRDGAQPRPAVLDQPGRGTKGTDRAAAPPGYVDRDVPRHDTAGLGYSVHEHPGWEGSSRGYPAADGMAHNSGRYAAAQAGAPHLDDAGLQAPVVLDPESYDRPSAPAGLRDPEPGADGFYPVHTDRGHTSDSEHGRAPATAPGGAPRARPPMPQPGGRWPAPVGPAWERPSAAAVSPEVIPDEGRFSRPAQPSPQAATAISADLPHTIAATGGARAQGDAPHDDGPKYDAADYDPSRFQPAAFVEPEHLSAHGASPQVMSDVASRHLGDGAVLDRRTASYSDVYTDTEYPGACAEGAPWPDPVAQAPPPLPTGSFAGDHPAQADQLSADAGYRPVLPVDSAGRDENAHYPVLGSSQAPAFDGLQDRHWTDGASPEASLAGLSGPTASGGATFAHSRAGTPARPDGSRRPIPVEKAVAQQLAAAIPRRMTARAPAGIEVRLARSDLQRLLEGNSGATPEGGLGLGTARPYGADTPAFSLRLRAPAGGFMIDSNTRETQWIGARPEPFESEFAVWRFNVTAVSGGRRRLVATLSARQIGADGLPITLDLPEQSVEVRVAANIGHGVLNIATWMLFAGLGALAATYGRSLYQPLVTTLTELLK